MTVAADRGERAAGLPSGWTAEPIQAGLLLYDSPPSPEYREEIGRIPGDPSRPVLAVHGSGGSAPAAVGPALAPLFGRGGADLGGGLRPLRLILPKLPPRHAQWLAENHSLDLIATSGLLKVRPARVVTWGFSENKPAAYWQWHRYVPGRRPQPVGAVYPSPRWDTAMAGVDTELPLHGLGLTVGRVAAGVTVYPGESSAVDFLRCAAGIQPDPDRLIVAVAPTVDERTVLAVLESLLGMLPAEAARGLRLAWSGATPLAAPSGLVDLCHRYGVEIVVPDTTLVQDPGSGSLLAWGVRGLGRWLRLSPGGRTETLGSLHPAPRWQSLLRAMVLRYCGGAVLEEVPAGLRLHRPGGPETARLASSVPPDEARVTFFADGDASRPADRADLEGLIEHLPASLARSFRLVMRGAVAGGPRAYGQWLANRFGADVSVASGVPGEVGGPGSVPSALWTDFRLERRPAFSPARLLTPGPASGTGPAPASGTGPAPRPALAAPPAVPPPGPYPADVLVAGPDREGEARPVPAGAPALAPVVTPSPLPAPPVTRSSPEPEPAAGGVPVRAVFPRGYRSTEEERRRLRDEGGARRDRHQAVVSRLLTERPALRGALSREPEEAITTDLSALRAYLSGDLPDLDRALRSGEPGDRGAEAACVVSALRHLAADRGPVYLTADVGEPEAAGYAAGRVLVEPTFVRATSRPPASQGDTLYAMWSRTARRVGPLGAGDDPGEVLFAAGSLFAVLAVDQGERRVVFLDERIRADASPELTESDLTTLERLRAAVAAHPEPPAPDAPTARGFALGLDDTGRRYTPA